MPTKMYSKTLAVCYEPAQALFPKVELEPISNFGYILSYSKKKRTEH